MLYRGPEWEKVESVGWSSAKEGITTNDNDTTANESGSELFLLLKGSL